MYQYFPSPSPALNPLDPNEDINLYLSNVLFFKKAAVISWDSCALSFLAVFAQTRVSGAFVEDYFQMWINIYLVL